MKYGKLQQPSARVPTRMESSELFGQPIKSMLHMNGSNVFELSSAITGVKYGPQRRPYKKLDGITSNRFGVIEWFARTSYRCFRKMQDDCALSLFETQCETPSIVNEKKGNGRGKSSFLPFSAKSADWLSSNTRRKSLFRRIICDETVRNPAFGFLLLRGSPKNEIPHLIYSNYFSENKQQNYVINYVTTVSQYLAVK